jgi:copper chaperone
MALTLPWWQGRDSVHHPLQERTMIELTLPTMTCGHCVATVTRTVQRLDAAARVQIDLPSHKVQIESSQPAEAIERALADEGYPAQ